MSFWQRVKDRIKEENTTQEWVAKKVGVSGDTFRRWMSKPIMPNADQAYIISVELNTTVEYLIEGTAGLNYIVKWAEENGARWKPPPRMVPLIDAAEKLSDTELKKLIEIAKICKNDETESLPRKIAK